MIPTHFNQTYIPSTLPGGLTHCVFYILFMTITVTGKFFNDDDGCSYYEFESIEFNHCDNDDDNMFNALLFAHQTITAGDVKYLSIGPNIDDEYQFDVVNIMKFYNVPQPIVYTNDMDISGQQSPSNWW